MNLQLKRTIAGLIDVIVIGIATASLQGFLFSITFIARMFGLMQDFDFWDVATVVSIIAITIYETLFLHHANGKTLGKMLLGLQVVEHKDKNSQNQYSSKQTMDIYACFLRSLSKAIMMRAFGGIFFMLNIGYLALHPTTRMAYDYFATTTVILEGGQ